MEIRVLGPLEVVSNGSVLGTGGPKQRLVLALLVEAEGRVVSADALIDRVWGESPPGDVRSSLHTYISRLRRIFGEDLQHVGNGYRLHLDDTTVDARVFQSVFQEALAEDDPAMSATRLRDALAMWRGEAYGDLRDEPALRPELTRLDELRRSALEARVDADLASGHDGDLIGELEVLIARHPFDEGFRRQHMLALYRAGRHVEALRAFGRARTAFGEIGVEPSAELAALEQQMLQHDPTLRPAAAPATSRTEARNPYKGLRPFHEDDAGDFYGRESLIEDLLERLEHEPLVAVVGPSGIGKSSAVRAGLVPVVRRDGIGTEPAWLVTEMYPGSAPFEELAAALLRVSAEPAANLAEELLADSRGLLRASKRLFAPDDHILLVIDQFEELFYLADETERTRFLESLAVSLDDERARIKVVLTLRADYLDKPLNHPEFGRLLGGHLVTVPALDRTQLGAAIEQPAAAVGVAIEPGLTGHIVDEVVQRPGALPLLQYAMTELFEQRRGNVLTIDGYRELGGVGGALGRRAEELYADLDSTGRETCRRVFLRLVSVGPHVADSRRRVPRHELEEVVVDRLPLRAVLDGFGERRLHTFDWDTVAESPTVEIAHEALLTGWDRLSGWVDEMRESLLLQTRLRTAVDEWDGAGRSDDYLLTGGRLHQFDGLAADDALPLSDAEHKYLELSGERERGTATRKRRTRFAVMAALGIAALISSLLALAAFQSRQDTEEARNLAQARYLVASGLRLVEQDPELAQLLLLEAHELAGDEVIAGGFLEGLHAAVLSDRELLRYPVDGWDGAVMTADGNLAISLNDNVIRATEVATGTEAWTTELPTQARWYPAGSRWGAVPSVDGASILVPAMVIDEGQVGLYEIAVATGDWALRPVDWPCELTGVVATGYGMVDTTGPLFVTSWIPEDGECGPSEEEGQDPDLTLLRVGANGAVTELGSQLGDFEGAGSLSGDGTRLAYWGNGETVVIDLATLDEVTRLEGEPGTSLNYDGTQIGFGEGALWDVEGGEPVVEFDGLGSMAIFSMDGSHVINDDTPDGRVRVWDAVTGHELVTLPPLPLAGSIHSSRADSILVKTRSEHLVYSIAPLGEIAVIPMSRALRPAWSLDVAGSRIAVSNWDDLVVEVFDKETGTATLTVADHYGQSIALSPEGRHIAAQHVDRQGIGPIDLIDAATGDVLLTYEGMCAATWNWDIEAYDGPDCRPFPETPFANLIHEIDYSPGGELIAASMKFGDGEVVIWDAETGAVVEMLVEPEDEWGLMTIAWSPDGGQLAVAPIHGSKAELIVYEASGWTEVGRVQAAGDDTEATARQIRYSPDGQTLLRIGHVTTDLTVFDTATWQQIDQRVLFHAEAVRDFEVSPSGDLVVTAGVDGFVGVHSLDTLETLYRIPVDPGQFINLEFLDDRRIVYTNGGTAPVFTLDPAELIEIAQDRVGRDFTPEECATYNISRCSG